MPLHLRITGEKGARLGDLAARTFAACGGTIGRATDNDWPIPDPDRYLSGRHALIDFQAGAYYLVDTSRNGVYVNGADTPVGKGNPQRLFDGDRLRIGEYEIEVQISGNDELVPDDGMRDSVVRAQLVPEDESVEMALMADDRLLVDSAFQRHLRPETSLRLNAVAPQAGSATARAVALPAREPAPDPRQLAVAELLAAAGLEREALAGVAPAEVLETAGRLLRVLLGGIMDLLRERSRLRDSLRLPQTVTQATEHNPLKFAPGTNEALLLLLRDQGSACLRGDQAVAAALGELRQHDETLHRATRKAICDYIERFDPEDLRRRFDQALKRPALLAGANRLKYWELYEETYQTLAGQEDGAPPQLYQEDLSRAYVEELENRQRRR